MDEVLDVFIVVVKGHENKSSVVIAKNGEEAMNIAMNNPILEELGNLNPNIVVFNITNHFSRIGYDLVVLRKGMFH